MVPLYPNVPILRHDASNSDVWWLALSRYLHLPQETRRLAFGRRFQYRRRPAVEDVWTTKLGDPVIYYDHGGQYHWPSEAMGSLQTSLDEFLTSKGLFDSNGEKTDLGRRLDYIGIDHGPCKYQPEVPSTERKSSWVRINQIDWVATKSRLDILDRDYEAAIAVFHGIFNTLDQYLQERYSKVPTTVELLVSIFTDAAFFKSMGSWGKRQLRDAANTAFTTDLRTYLSELRKLDREIKKLNKLQEVGREFYENIQDTLPPAYLDFYKNSVIKVGSDGIVKEDHFDILCYQLTQYVLQKKREYSGA